MKRIAIRTKKGGVGKTTTAANVGHWLSMQKKRVCLVDIDPQYNLTTMLGIPQTQVKGTLLDVLDGKPIDEVIIEARPNLFLIPGNRDLADPSSVLKGRLPELTIRNRLQEIDSWDYMIFDCPPSSSLLIDNVLCFVNAVWSPLQVEFLSLEGLDQVVDEVAELNEVFKPYGVNAKITAIIPTMFDSRVRISEEIQKAAKEKYTTLITSPIRRNVRISESPSFGQTIFEYDPDGKGAQDYETLSKELSA